MRIYSSSSIDVNPGDVLVVNIQGRLKLKAILLPVVVKDSPDEYGEFYAWPKGIKERAGLYQQNSIVKKCNSLDDAYNYIDEIKGITVEELRELKKNMKIQSSKKVTCGYGGFESNRDYIIDCIENGWISENTVLYEFLYYCSEDDCDEIIRTLGLDDFEDME